MENRVPLLTENPPPYISPAFNFSAQVGFGEGTGGRASASEPSGVSGFAEKLFKDEKGTPLSGFLEWARRLMRAFHPQERADAA